MRYGLALLTTLAWGLWFGGMIALFLFVNRLFTADRSTAIIAAPQMFLAFERFQIILAAVALLAVASWRLMEHRAVLSILFTYFVVAAVGVVISATVITPKLERLRPAAGEPSSPEFRQLHGRSMALYSLQAVALLVAGLTLPLALVRPPHQTAPETALPKAPPA